MTLSEMDIAKMAGNLSKSIDTSVFDSMVGRTYSDQLKMQPPRGSSVLSKKDIDDLLSHQKEEKTRKATVDINEMLKDKGYPDFQKILDYYLQEHPEYEL